MLKTNTESLISCMYHEIRIRDRARECPHYPFSLPISETFRLVNADHLVKVQHVNAAEKQLKFTTPHFEKFSGDPEYSKLARALLEKNRGWVDARKLGYDKGSLVIPMETTMLIALLSGFSACLTIGTFMCKCLRGGGSSSGGEHINVMTAPQAPVATEGGNGQRSRLLYYPVLASPDRGHGIRGASAAYDEVETVIP